MFQFSPTIQRLAQGVRFTGVENELGLCMQIVALAPFVYGSSKPERVVQMGVKEQGTNWNWSHGGCWIQDITNLIITYSPISSITPWGHYFVM